MTSPNKDSYKGNLQAERVVWMSRTSDVIGSHIKKDLDSYLTLIRRKIQEKCATTQELINQIRKTKVGDGSFVTPNEFRFTLIKFGLIFPQSLVDRIFNVFDSDRSGTMDFDEFAMWIMNSEFRPVVKEEATVKVTPEEALRARLQDAINSNPHLFKTMKREISYLDLISAISEGKMKTFSERDARYVFQILDQRKTGFIETMRIVKWANTGEIMSEQSTARDAAPAPSLSKCIHNICGRNFSLLRECFSRYPAGTQLSLGFDEFRGNLLQGNLGRNRKDLEALFIALGGKYVKKANGDGYTIVGTADVTKLLDSCPSETGPSQDDPSAKKVSSTETVASRADRRLRDAVRKCYKVMKNELEDSNPSGFIEPEGLLRVINKHCMPLAFEDFRVVLSGLKTEGKKVCWQHFLHIYNPKKAPHILDGTKTISEFTFPPASASGSMFASTSESIVGPEGGNASTASLNTSMTRSKSVGTLGNREDERKMRRIWQGVLRECQRNDPERSGLVNRHSFVNALENTQDSPLNSETISQLANKYTAPESGGLIDYVSCFRNYLNDLACSMSLKSDSSTFRPASMTESRQLGHMHPWEFKYSRKSKDSNPYWKEACVQPKEAGGEEVALGGRGRKLSPHEVFERGAHRDPEVMQRLLKQYDGKLQYVCGKCPSLIQPVYKELKADFNKSRPDPSKNEVLTPQFFSIMQSHNIPLSHGELGTIARAFRGKGMPEVVNYNDFLGLVKIFQNTNSRPPNPSQH